MSFFNLNSTRFSNHEISPGHTTFSLWFFFFFWGGADFIYSIFYIVTCIWINTICKHIEVDFNNTVMLLLNFKSLCAPQKTILHTFWLLFLLEQNYRISYWSVQKRSQFSSSFEFVPPCCLIWGVLGKKDKQSSDKDVLATVLHAGVNFPKRFFQLGREWRWAVESVHGILDLPPNLQCIWCAP